MFRSLRRALPAVLLALIVIPIPTLAQTDAVTLQLKLNPGEATYYDETGTRVLTLDTPGARAQSETKYSSREIFRVLEVGALGGMMVEYAIDDYRLTEEGKTTEVLLPPWTLRVDPDGKVLDRIVGPEVIEDFPFPLPGKPVRVGESWSRRAGWAEGELNVRGTGTYTLTSLGMSPQGRTARVRFVLDGVLVPSSRSGSAPSAVLTRGTSKITGEYEWIIDAGRVGQYAYDEVITVEASVMIPGMVGSVRLSAKGNTRGVPVAAESITVPAVSAEHAVAPGKGIGPVELSATVEDVAKRFGASDYRELDLGYNVWSRRWSNGLVAYVAEDNTKVLGLEIGDRRYRTEKGVGVGSTQGAVFLAYGMKLHRLEMMIPGHGPMRLLVYDEQGIAFGVVSEEALASRTVGPMPVHRVKWVTVFAPGSAAKIFPMPGKR